jgi:hypothetical protein
MEVSVRKGRGISNIEEGGFFRGVGKVGGRDWMTRMHTHDT